MDLNYTKEDVVKNDFLFVSYKHEDSATVTDTINYLLAQGIRIWYDADLNVGEKWPEVAEGLIKNDNCRGVIFFNSEDSFKSDPVYLERGFAMEKAEANKNSGRPFLMFPVNIGKPSTMRILKSVFESLPDDDKEIEKTFPLKYLQGICTIFSSDIIYCYADPENNEEYKQRLSENIKKALPSVIDAAALSAREIEKVIGVSHATVSLGIYKGSSVDVLPAYFLSKDQRVEYQGVTYLVEGGIAYDTRSITWRPVYCDDEKFVLLAQNVVETKNGGEALNEWLSGSFYDLAFTDQEKKEISCVRLLTESDIEKSKTPDLLVFNDSDSHWWLDARAMGALQKVVKKDGSIYNSGYNYRTKKSGVRPIICVNKDFITSINKK